MPKSYWNISPCTRPPRISSRASCAAVFWETRRTQSWRKRRRAYLNSGTDIRATLRPILLDGLADPAVNKPIVKRPLDYVASALRALAADSDCGANVQKHLTDMGQPLYQWPMPDGFPGKSLGMDRVRCCRAGTMRSPWRPTRSTARRLIFMRP